MFCLFMGLIFIFIMTMTGVILALFFRRDILDNTVVLSFALGVMLASGIFSLLIPSITMLKTNNTGFYPLYIGVAIGIAIIVIVPKFFNKEKNEKKRLFLAMTIHNIPEGFSVGLSLFIAYLSKDSEILLNAIMLFIAIGIQNIPEGFATTLPYKIEEGNKKAFFMGFISSIVEPLAGLCALVFVSVGDIMQPYGLAIGAGAMIITVLIEMKNNLNFKGIMSFIIGFTVMTLLDLFL